MMPSPDGKGASISMGLRIQLSVMMFLQYFVWGIWLPMLVQHLDKNLHLTGTQIGWVMSVYGLGAIVGPFVAGQIADRWLATEKLLAGLHFIGGGLLIWSAYETSFWGVFTILLIYCTLYMPTMGLTNSLTFRSVGEGNQGAFPGIRLWGTIGWIAAGWFLAIYLEYTQWGLGALKPLFELVGEPGFRDCLRVAGVCSILYSVYCLFLPHTPPQPADSAKVKSSAILESLELLKDPSFAVLILTTGLIGIMLSFYFACENFFLEDIGVQAEKIGAYMTIGQIAELGLMLLVPLSVAKLGVKKTMIIGGAAWALRFGVSMLGSPQWLMISTIALHGFAFGFFFVVAQMYVDRSASNDIKASAQSMLIFVVYGMGSVFGSVISGSAIEYFTRKNWTGIWSGPFLITLVAMLIFIVFFKEREIKRSSSGRESADLA